jgi:hypothetical protein
MLLCGQELRNLMLDHGDDGRFEFKRRRNISSLVTKVGEWWLSDLFKRWDYIGDW